MRRYETTFILDPDLAAEERVPVLDRMKELVSQYDGFFIGFNEWGRKQLAYEIRKKGRGYYVHSDYCGDGALVNEIERTFRIDDRVLKYMTVLLAEKADLEKIKAEMAAAEAAEESPPEAPEAEAETPAAEPASGAETETESPQKEA